jgi:mannose-P-dolichol utilization defect protein 1
MFPSPLSLSLPLSLPLSSLLPSPQISQVYTTFANKTTGQLSVITSYLNWSGTAARIFTTLQETQDPIILIMYISSFIVNSIIMLQFGIYWNAATSKDSTKKEE